MTQVMVVGLLTSALLTQTTAANQLVSARFVNEIQTKQAKLIIEGVRFGKLTPKEARKLREEQFEIISMERSMREDGSLSTSELELLFEKLELSQKNINILLRNSISTHAIAINTFNQ